MLAVLTIISGIVLIVLSLAGHRSGTPKERGLMAVVGLASVAYSAWVMHQTSGVFYFSVLPIAWAVVAVLRTVGIMKPTQKPKEPQIPQL